MLSYTLRLILFQAVKQESDGSQKRVCIDGKQRLTSVWRWVAQPYPFVTSGEKYFYKSNAARKGGRVLPDRYKHIFRNKTFVCVEYDGITENEEREVFQRVQLGMALTPAERMQAINSPRATFIREILPEFVTDGLSAYLEWDTSRAADFRGISTAVYHIENWIANGPPGLPTLTKWLSHKEDFPDKTKQDLRQTFAIFLALAKDAKLAKVFRLPGVKKVAPVEIIAISTLIARFKGKMSLAQLSEAIGDMRADVRKHETDIRNNNRCLKLLNTFIERLKPPKVAGTTAAKQLPISSLKRKRETSDDSGSDASEGAISDGSVYEEKEKKKPSKKTAKSEPKPPSSKAEQPRVEQLPTPSSTTPVEPEPTSRPPSRPSQPLSPPRTAPYPGPSGHSYSALPQPIPISTRLQAIRAAKDSVARPPPPSNHYDEPQQSRYPPHSPQHPPQYESHPSYPQSQHPSQMYYPTQQQPYPQPPPSQQQQYRQSHPLPLTPTSQQHPASSLLSRVGPPGQEPPPPPPPRYVTGANAFGRPPTQPRNHNDNHWPQRCSSGSGPYGDGGWR
ncbi:hypothetical protein QCA50_008399 [Cerrena zonata]|uniref:DUF262 domain-containing protein n=1 Tax=Cerrena zonata TaxID=2478898 RepID=A0AAW0GD29_9APHY